MTLRRKTLLITVLSLLGFLAILLVTTRYVILNEFSKLEVRETQTNINRLLNAFKEDMNNLEGVTDDDSRWDEAYRFAQGTNPAFPDNTFNSESAASLRLNLIMIFDNSGKLLFGSLYDTGYKRLPLPPETVSLISSNPKLLQHASLTAGVTGNLISPQGPIMISIRPIRTSQGGGPVAGSLVFGRNLDAVEIQRLAGGVLLNTSTQNWNEPQLPSDFITAKAYLAGSSPAQNLAPVFSLPVNANTIAGYTVLKDLNQNEALLLRIELTRTLYLQALGNVRLLSIYLIIAGLAFGGILMLLINMVLIAPVSLLKEQTHSLGLRGEFSTRIPAHGADEVANLAGSFNGLLEALDVRTKELKAASNLQHRLSQYKMSAEICHRISGFLNQQELLDKTVDILQEQFKLTFAGIYLVHEASGSMKLAAGSGETGKQLAASGFKVPLTSLYPIIRPVTSRRTAYEPEANFSTLGPIYPHLPSTRSTLDIPLIAGHQVIGILSLHSNIPNNFDDGDIAVLEGIANSLATGLENVRRYQEVEGNLEKIRTLHNQYLGEAWSETAKAAGGLSYTYENEKPYELVGQTHRVDVPIELRDKIIGRLVLEIDRSNLSSEEMDMVESIATETAVALENTRLLEETQRRAEREQFLADISNKVRASSDVESILRTAILELGRSLKASEGLIRLESGEEKGS
jgi:sensor domain CHASE-containing protein/GAF domain-containing protein